MRDAIAVFENWMHRPPPVTGANQGKGCRTDDPAVQEERAQRRDLAESHANAHARSRLSSGEEFARVAAEDRADALRRLRAAPRGAQAFSLPATSFVAVFGGPGEHGYGRHTCDTAAAAGLPLFRCTCSFRGPHTVTVDATAGRQPTLAAGLPARFLLCYDGAGESGRLTAQPPPGQRGICDFFRPAAGHKRPRSAGPEEGTGGGDRRPAGEDRPESPARTGQGQAPG